MPIPLYRSRRSSLDIIEAILSNVPPEGIRKTHLANKAMLDYKVMDRYVQLLLDEGLLQIDQNGLLRVTEKGIKFLEQYKELKNMVRVEKIFEAKKTI